MSCTQHDQLVAPDELAASRQQLYSFLSGAFDRPPSPETIAMLRDREFLESAAEMVGDQTLAALRAFAESDRPVAEVEAAARQEFMNLLKVPGRKYVPAYESVFRDVRAVEGKKARELLMGQSAIDVQKWYRLAALDISADYKELPDHIALELAYLAHLCAREQEFAAANAESTLKRAREMQRDFLAAHVVSWVEPLAEKIREKTQHPYFLAVAAMLVEFTRHDLAALEDWLGPSSGSPVPVYPTSSSGLACSIT